VQTVTIDERAAQDPAANQENTEQTYESDFERSDKDEDSLT